VLPLERYYLVIDYNNHRSGVGPARAAIGADDVDYAFMADTVDDDRIVVVERWADEQTLAVHFAQHQP
jgi:hypothetical protein